MASLADCIKRHKIDIDDAKRIRELADGYLADGEKPQVARGSAIEDMLNEIDREEKAIRKQLIPVSEQLKEEVKKKTAKQGERGSVEVPAKEKQGFEFENKDIEKRFKDAQNVDKESLLSKTKKTLTGIGHKMSRTFEHLPRNKEFAQLQFDLLKLQKQKSVSSDKTLRNLQGVVLDLDKNDYDIFSRKVVLNDLNEVAKEGKQLPFGFDEKTVKKELARLEKSTNPMVEKAIEKRNKLLEEIKSDYIKAQKDIGFDVEDRLTRENYFRHQVIEYANLKAITGSGKKLKTPTSRGFLKKRAGSGLDILSNYLEVEHEVMAQMLYDIQVAKTIKKVKKKYDISDDLKKKAKEGQNWKENLPEGYTLWQPREGSVFYMADSIPAQVAEKITEGMLNDIKLSPEVVKKILAVGGKRMEFAVKEEVAETLDNLFRDKSHNLLVEAQGKAIRAWKVWQLIQPRRWFKYNARNLTGDADAAFAGAPSIFKKSPQAFKELLDVYTTDKPMTKNLQDWFERGGFESNLQAQEIGEINKLKLFIRLQEKKGSLKNIPTAAWQKYWKAARLTTDFREGILRYAAYLKALENLKKTGLPKDYWASIPEEIQGLDDIKDRAYWMSNDLLGAYDRVSVFGQAMREHIFPFWSWKEVNFKRYKQMTANAFNDKRLMAKVGRRSTGIAIRSPLIAARVGTFVLKATAFSAFLQVWNNTKFPEEEKELPKNVREKPHIILGRDSKGNIIYFSRLGALGDLLEWFNLDMAPRYIDKWFSGEMTITEIAKEMAKAPVNIMAQGSVPFTKMAAELMTRRALYPDAFNPRPIRDRTQHLMRSIGLGDEYALAAGKPSKPYKESIPGFFIYSADPDQAAYGDVFQMKREYMKKIGKYGEGFWMTDKGNALYNFKLAVRYDDEKAGKKYLAEYISLARNQDQTNKQIIAGINSAFKGMSPLAGMSQKDMVGFIKSLKPEEKEKVKTAFKYYLELQTTVPTWKIN